MGYMGSGKSLIGRSLANAYDLKYLDLDDFIETKEKKSISKIFEDNGEIYFRKKESECLKEVLETKKKHVISLGGGTPCFANNMEVINSYKDVKSVYLNTSVDELTDRLFKERNKRPLIAHITEKEALNDFIRKHLFERSFYYNQASYVIKTDNKNPEEIVSEFNTLLF